MLRSGLMMFFRRSSVRFKGSVLVSDLCLKLVSSVRSSLSSPISSRKCLLFHHSTLLRPSPGCSGAKGASRARLQNLTGGGRRTKRVSYRIIRGEGPRFPLPPNSAAQHLLFLSNAISPRRRRHFLPRRTF